MKPSTKFLPLIFVAALAFTALVPAARAEESATNTIVDVAIAANSSGPFAGQFDILIAAVLAADPAVLQELTNRSQNTVFAPTDDAFVALLAELGITADDLLGNQALLTEVLLYHVAWGNRNAASVLASPRIRTLQGEALFQSGGVLTDSNGRTSTIIATDIFASNGVIHVIDTVVLPDLSE
ncbi:MAG: fasciclin domain-containing protein [Anaerolineales bacterium]